MNISSLNLLRSRDFWPLLSLSLPFSLSLCEHCTPLLKKRPHIESKQRIHHCHTSHWLGSMCHYGDRKNFTGPRECFMPLSDLLWYKCKNTVLENRYEAQQSFLPWTIWRGGGTGFLHTTKKGNYCLGTIGRSDGTQGQPLNRQSQQGTDVDYVYRRFCSSA